jgi:hypothetical protein
MMGRTNSLGGKPPYDVAFELCNWLERIAVEGMDKAQDDSTWKWFETHRNNAQTRRTGLRTASLPGMETSRYKAAPDVQVIRTPEEERTGVGESTG